MYAELDKEKELVNFYDSDGNLIISMNKIEFKKFVINFKRINDAL